MPRHGAGGQFRLAGEQGLDNRQVLVRFFREPLIVVPFFIVLPGQVAKGPEENLQPADLLGEESVAARLGDQVVQSAVDGTGLRNEARAEPILRSHQAFEIGRDVLESAGINAPAGGAGRFALQGLAHLADLANFAGGNLAHDGPAVGQQVDDPDAAQRDQGFPDRRVTDPMTSRQFLRDQAFAGAQPTTKHVGQDRLDDRLPPQAVIAAQSAIAV